MLKNRIAFLRKVLKLTQANFAKPVGLSGAYISAIELEKNNKLSSGTTRLIEQVYNISESWLNTGEVNKNYCYEIGSTIQLNRISIKELAEKLNVTEDFINAIIQKQVSPSAEFFHRIMAAIGVEPRGDLKDQIKQGIAERQLGGAKEVEQVRGEMSVLIGTLEMFREQFGIVKEENERLKAENAELKRRLGVE